MMEFLPLSGPQNVVRDLLYLAVPTNQKWLQLGTGETRLMTVMTP
jgi:hypothetical protein